MARKPPHDEANHGEKKGEKRVGVTLFFFFFFWFWLVDGCGVEVSGVLQIRLDGSLMVWLVMVCVVVEVKKKKKKRKKKRRREK